MEKGSPPLNKSRTNAAESAIRQGFGAGSDYYCYPNYTLLLFKKGIEVISQKEGSFLSKCFPLFVLTYTLVSELSVLSTSLMVAAALTGVQIALSSPLLMQSMKYLISPA